MTGAIALYGKLGSNHPALLRDARDRTILCVGSWRRSCGRQRSVSRTGSLQAEGSETSPRFAGRASPVLSGPTIVTPPCLEYRQDLGLDGKRAIVLSSSRGLGLGVAQALAAEGAAVIMTARSADRLGRGRGHQHRRPGGGNLRRRSGPNVEAIYRAASKRSAASTFGREHGDPGRTALAVKPEEWTPSSRPWSCR